MLYPHFTKLHFTLISSIDETKVSTIYPNSPLLNMMYSHTFLFYFYEFLNYFATH